jgi:hypothetical protein
LHHEFVNGDRLAKGLLRILPLCLGAMSLFRRSFNRRPNLRSLIVRTLSAGTPGSQDPSQQSDQQPGADVSSIFQRAAIRSGIRWKSPCQVPHILILPSDKTKPACTKAVSRAARVMNQSTVLGLSE